MTTDFTHTDATESTIAETEGGFIDNLLSTFDRKHFETLTEEISYEEYLDRCKANPLLIRTSYQRAYDMIASAGTREYKKYRKTFTRYKFFDQGERHIIGMDSTLMELVRFIKGAAGGHGPEKRILLLHGPVGSAKSTILSVIKRGLEAYTATDEGALYTFRWVNLPFGSDGINVSASEEAPMHDDPLLLLPAEVRPKFVANLNEIYLDSLPEGERDRAYELRCDGDLDPLSQIFFDHLLAQYKGDLRELYKNHIRVTRLVFSEKRRVGIGTFQPKDEKNQDATELTGDINYAKLPHYGSDSDPRAFNFDGELCKGNRGVVEFIEILKLNKEFLYDLLTASQEQSIKPKKFAQVRVDLMLIGHSNNPEYEKLKEDRAMEAFRDRTVKIDVPYNLTLTDEQAVYEMDYGPGRIRQHVAPHTLEIASLFAVLTRLIEDRDNNLTLADKARLYDGKMLPGWGEDRVKELHDKYPNEGMYSGVSARYVQEKLANCLSDGKGYVSPFRLLNELKAGLRASSLLTNMDEVDKYERCVDLATKEYDEIIKDEIRKALVDDEEAVQRLCDKYLDNVFAYIEEAKVKNPFTGQDQAPDERLMRSIEEKVGISEQMIDDFRKSITTFVGTLSRQDKKFTWDSNPQLKKALERKLFDDTKDTIKLSALSQAGTSVNDKHQQEKIDAIKARLIKKHGYIEESATDVLEYAGSSLFRGENADED